MEQYPKRKAEFEANQIQELAGNNPTSEHYDLASKFIDDMRALDERESSGFLTLPIISLPKGITLSPHEIKVVKFLCEGLTQEHKIYSAKIMSEKLRITEGTYREYLFKMRAKTGIKPSIQLALLETEQPTNEPNPPLVLHLIPLPRGVSLTEKEKEVIKLMQDNLRMKHYIPAHKEIVDILGLTEGAWKARITVLLEKTGLTDSEQLAFLDIPKE